MQQSTITINGQEREVTELPANLAQVVAELGLKADRVAVELNGTIAVRGLWETTAVTAGDRLEVVHFVGGGASAGS